MNVVLYHFVQIHIHKITLMQHVDNDAWDGAGFEIECQDISSVK